MPQAEIADLVEAFGQDMLEEAADELVAGEPAGPPARGFALLVADGDGCVVETDDAGVGDGDAEDVAGEVVEHGLLALAPWRDVDDPGLAPGGVGEDEVGAPAGRSMALSLPRTSLARALSGTRKACGRDTRSGRPRTPRRR